MSPFNAFRQRLVVTRKDGGTFAANGLYEEGSDQQLAIYASVQPASGEVMQSLPEAQRTSSAYSLYSDALLRVAHQASGTVADTLDVLGVTHTVVRRQQWGNGVLSHYYYLVVEVPQ